MNVFGAGTGRPPLAITRGTWYGLAAGPINPLKGCGMASVSNDGGLFRVLWVDGERRRVMRLGRVSQRHAEEVARHIEELMRAKQTRHPVDARTVAWLTGISDDLHGRLSDYGLCLPRATGTLGGLLRLVLEERKADLKAESLRRLQQTADKLISTLGDGRVLHTITPADAAHWRAELTRAGLSLATVKTHVGNAKTLIGEAVRRGIITANPFGALKGGVTSHRSGRIVSAEELAKVIDAAPSLEWKCIIGLAGWAGLRHPSETSLLRWQDVDFAAGRLRVRSPKTERHHGHADGAQARRQPVPGSAKAFAAIPMTLFSLSLTSRRYMSWIGLWALLMVHFPRGLSMTAPSRAA